MGVGPNYGLDKGFLVEGSSAVAFGEIAVPGTGEQAVGRATSAGAATFQGVFQESVDVGDVLTGKVFANVRVTGITRVIAGAAVTKGARVTNDTSARAVAATQTAAGAQPKAVLGIAQTAATAAGQHIDVLLTPGATY
jgi:hypothetical protein